LLCIKADTCGGGNVGFPIRTFAFWAYLRARSWQGPPKALSSPLPIGSPEVPTMDVQLVYDTIFVAWVLGLALYMFHLGRLVGASGWPNR
jgi:hypothetical protein